MKAVNYHISEDIFKLFLGYTRGVLFLKNVKNKTSPERLTNLIREEEKVIREKYNLYSLLESDRIISWRNAYIKTGIKPGEFRPSIEAMLRRVLKNQQLPSINALVDIGNYFSLKYLIPIGCHSLQNINNEMALRYANGSETFIPFGQNEADNPLKGEIIFTDGNDVMTRRWTWRQSNHSIITLDSGYVEFNIDGLYPVTKDDVDNIGEEMIKLINDFFDHPSHSFEVITKDNPSIMLEY
ncbi:MAG: phenylalanine--tRNA ligase beta subunit-related protein [Ignavibacteria bacterium]|jgi:DNA/RNA-binding domain of Phe-tRNA-synthetase-like protein